MMSTCVEVRALNYLRRGGRSAVARVPRDAGAG